MKYCALALVGVVAAIGLLSAQAPQAGNPGEELDKKLKLLRDEINELQKKRVALQRELKELLDIKGEAERLLRQEAERKEAERKQKEEDERIAKEAAEKKKHIAKVEIRGKLLVKSSANTWQMEINQLTWTLTFGDNKELLASAEKLAGKRVIIKGTVVNNTPPMRIVPYGLPQPPFPNPYPQPFPYPYPDSLPHPKPQPETLPPVPPYPTHLLYTPVDRTTILVESVQEAKD
jgi:hypothetical protein